MHEENKTKNRAAIALALCFCVLALTSFLAVKSSLNKISNSGMTAAENSTSSSQEQAAAAKTPVIDSNDHDASTTQESGKSQNAAPAAQKYIMPVEGPVVLKYSMSSLVYSNTLDQYMTHPGVDIAAKKSTEVKAIADGTVTKVYNDDRYGCTVCILHDDGVTSIYSNLDKHGLAEAGDQVCQGDKIGSVGDSALFESLDEAHLHFEMTKDSNCVDPGEFIDQLKQ